MIELVDNNIRSQNCITYVQEARVKIEHALQRQKRYKKEKQIELTEVKNTKIKITLQVINGRSDTTEKE